MLTGGGNSGYYLAFSAGKDSQALYHIAELAGVKFEAHMSLTSMNDGYAYICLSKDGKELKYKAHRLVAEAFIPNPDNLPYINHKNECKSDNRVENLEWCTKWYNEHYGTFHEKSVTNLRKKLGRPICQYDMNGNFIREYACIVDTDKHGFCSDSVGNCCRGRLKQHRGYIFRYKQ